jgi:hypothetical protein
VRSKIRIHKQSAPSKLPSNAGLSYMTDGGENLSYNDVTDGRTVGHVH